MLSKKEFEKEKEWILEDCKNDISEEHIKSIFEYIEQLEQRNEELGNGQNSLMQSRKKWKRRYYKERRKRKEADKAVEQIYEDYQDIGRIAFDYSDKIDSIKEKLEEMRTKLNLSNLIGYADEITDILSEVEEE